MIELVCFVAGAVLMFAAMRIRRARRRPAPRQRVRTDVRPPVRLVPGPIAADARSVALTLAEELATLVSGIEGRAHHLIGVAPNRAMLPVAAEAFLNSVQRLRTLYNKLLAFGKARTSSTGATDVARVVSGLRDELQQMQLGIEILWEPLDDLPPIHGSPEVVRDALLFLCAAMLRAERGATHLAIHAEQCFASDTPRVQLELVLEWVAEAKVPSLNLFADHSFALDLEAANNLITGLGGELTVSHLPGRSVRAVVHWSAAPSVDQALDADGGAETAVAPPPIEAQRVHEYGGALLLEADPSIRAMIASELKATGRNVFACADGAAAKSFLEATPDRFELLIVDHHERLDTDRALLEAIHRLAPGLKICVLAPGGAPAALPRVHCIEKPFGPHELRRALATVLAG